MSKKSRTGKSDDIIKNIGERMKRNKQPKEETDPPEEEITEEKTEVTETTEDEDIKETADQSKPDNWSENQSYRSSFMVTGEMEDDFESCRRKFRKNLKSSLSKQSAIELGWKLLNKLSQEYFEEVKATHSPDDDLVEALKTIIEEHY